MKFKKVSSEMVVISETGKEKKATKKGASDEEDITNWKWFKVRRARVKEIFGLPLNALDVKAALIQALISIRFWYVKEVLEACEADRYITPRITKQGQRGRSFTQDL